MKKTAVIVAGGTGVRMGSELPKQFLLLKNKPLLFYTIDVFLKAYDDLEIILVLPEAYVDMGQEIIDAYFDKDRVRITIGGATRFESVKNGLQQVHEEAIVFVHDAVRCLVSERLIRRCYEQALETGSAIPVIPSSDSVRLITEEGSDALEREKIVLVQTPQVFHSKILVPAFSIEQKGKFTDEASVVEAFGIKVSLVEGEQNNIKITHPIDLVMAEALLPSSAL
ncbi:2-C-methyl-D-erythritol 4-phosphate cytidylyltransferase [Niabella ginsenosidivorans]|uniref:2-C-methyl-D-erythritol 4-phosphate cytidylyltransferase n=1 Tax=Niabella ginsenosidivorans TaxID=1176587 RepID=A0A1A9I1N5_9BACT|nr:2-C-methyl-D-erythritol 4-phosphate cytidylyltransferase [Niabella ginsenosidivorans]ANH81577.1 2-C-methyl-D-erythritol 4-phosphate cytidylyltransferase [Niabella ginsenosidivorans]